GKFLFTAFRANEWNKNDERLLAAVEHGEVEKVASLLAKKGVSAVKLDSEGKSALHVAAARGHTDCLSVMLAHGADLSVTDAAGLSPLHLAAKNNHIECSKKLLQVKTASGNIQTVQLLCELKSPINLKDADGLPSLLLAAKHAHAEVCSTLLECGAEIDASDNSGRTALMLAIESNAVSAVEVLVHRGADLLAVDSQGHDALYYFKLSGNSEVKSVLTAALNKQQISDKKSPRSPLSSGPSSPSIVTSTGTPASNKSETPKRFNYKEDEVRGTVLREEVEKLHEERNMLLETIEDLRQTVEQTVGDPELDIKGLRTSVLILLTCTFTSQKHSTLQENEDLKDASRPNSMASNSSFHSTKDEFEPQPQDHSPIQIEKRDIPVDISARREDDEKEGGKGGNKEEIRLLRQALESVQVKLLETRKENRSLQAKLTDTQERYHQAVEEVEELRTQMAREDDELERHVSSTLEHEVKQLKAQLIQSGSEQEKAAQQIKQLEEMVRRAEEERESVKEKEQRTAQIEELYKEAKEEIRMLQEALRGTVPVEAAAKDFEEMKAELNEVIAGLQRRLLELSHSYSETKSQLGAAQKQLAEAQAERSTSSSPSSNQQQQQVQMLNNRMEELQTVLADTEKNFLAAQQEISVLRQEAEAQAQSTVALADHTHVMSSLGNAIKELESQAESLKEELHQKTVQVEALHNRLTAEKDVTPDDSVSRLDHETLREQMEGEVNHLTQLLQGALRKQDEMALEAADAWQKNRAEREALQELVMSREKENQTLSSRLAESQDAVCQLKQLVENHVASEREKNKKIDDLSREVGKLKDALNSLSQLSYSSGSPSKRQQQSQQLETMQQQIKQLQYQLAESKKQHNEIVSVYRMHLLYAVQGQMDEDVQKALKQILMMCKVPSQAKEAC
uniref:Uncharacterized protein n=1 Tax=Echeneis naucrates TaxID=173247 RepID=A0A665V4F7_ECHNA